MTKISNLSAMEPFAFGYLSSLGGIEFKDPTTPDKDLLAGSCPIGEQEPKLRCYTTDVYVVENVSETFSKTSRLVSLITIVSLRLMKVWLTLKSTKRLKNVQVNTIHVS